MHHRKYKGGEKIAKKTQINLAEIAAQTNIDDTLKTDQLLNKKFTINNVKKVNGMHGETFVGDLTLDGKNVEAWLGGNVVFRQINAMLESGDLPRDNLTMIRDTDSWGEPFVLTDA